MNKQLLDNEFYEKKELPARDWWESKRNLFNKYLSIYFCVFFIICMYSYYYRSGNLLIGFLIYLFFSLIYFTISNLALSGVWIIESIISRIFNLTFNNKIRTIIFRIILIILFLPYLLYFLINQLT